MGYQGFARLDADTGYVLEKETEREAIYRKTSGGSSSELQIYRIFPGIEMVVRDIIDERGIKTTLPSQKVLQIDHCMAGRTECTMKDGCRLFTGEGDLFISERENYSDSFQQPMGYFKGISWLFFLDEAQDSVTKMLPDYPILLENLWEKYMAEDKCFILHSRSETAAIVNGIYTIHPSAIIAWSQLAVLKLLIYLDLFDLSEEQHFSTYALQQVDIAKSTHAMLTKDIGKRFTIDELAEAQLVSPTALKKYFKGVYGKSIAAYMIDYRTNCAIELLRHTDQSVAEIATVVGYESQSKFTAMFHRKTGLTPLDYRKKSSSDKWKQSNLLKKANGEFSTV